MSIINERQKTHGEYADLAAVAQSLKESLRAAPNSHSLSSIQRESVELIATKLARIVCGNPDELDHWVDISGYADLVVFNLKDKNTASRANVTIMEMDPDESSDIPDPYGEDHRCKFCARHISEVHEDWCTTDVRYGAGTRFSKHLVWSR